MLRNYVRVLCALGLMVSVFSASFFANENGRIKGFVYDRRTNEPLSGANVLVLETRFGAATALKGKFVIPSVPVGSQTLVVTYICYHYYYFNRFHFLPVQHTNDAKKTFVCFASFAGKAFNLPK